MGAVLTYHQNRFRAADHRGKLCHVIQPAWALSAIFVPVESIASTSYRSTNEIPLSLLPATVLRNDSIFGKSWRWRKNGNIQGLPLASGKMLADMGVGMWSGRQIAFSLPAGLCCVLCWWVGIDRAACQGACVRCKIYRDEVAGNPIWTSGAVAQRAGGNSCGSGEPKRRTSVWCWLRNLLTRNAQQVICRSIFATWSHGCRR